MLAVGKPFAPHGERINQSLLYQMAYRNRIENEGSSLCLQKLMSVELSRESSAHVAVGKNYLSTSYNLKVINMAVCFLRSSFEVRQIWALTRVQPLTCCVTLSPLTSLDLVSLISNTISLTKFL